MAHGAAGPPTAETCAGTVLQAFSAYMGAFENITGRAETRFARRQWQAMQADAVERLDLYESAVDRTGSQLHDRLGAQAADRTLWSRAKKVYAKHLCETPAPELARTFFNSLTRRLAGTVGVDPAIEFIETGPGIAAGPDAPPVFVRYETTTGLAPAVEETLSGSGLVLNEKMLAERIPGICRRIADAWGEDKTPAEAPFVDVLTSVFYRGQGAYLIARVTDEIRTIPLVLALVHTERGVVVDAALTEEKSVSILFSYTRAAFFARTGHPRGTVAFIQSILPNKRRGEIYSALGFFKHGKTELFGDLKRHTAECGAEKFEMSPGTPGMVMITFNMPGDDLVLKLIRDRFESPKTVSHQKVLDQYEYVFRHFRAGRLIEAHAFEHLSFDRCWFDDDLLAHLRDEASRTVRLAGERVIVEHAYVERRVVPLDLYLRTADPKAAEAAVKDYGQAIKDLAVSNIFTGDMLLKNFGVTRQGRVVFYDYDEIRPLTACHFRKLPPPRSDEEEMAAEPWFFAAENDVFPEEFVHFLGLPPHLREVFLSAHKDLFEVAFWKRIQDARNRGEVERIAPYASHCRL